MTTHRVLVHSNYHCIQKYNQNTSKSLYHNMNIHIIIILLAIHFYNCLDFENIEICSSYKSYPTEHAHYGEKGVPSPQNYFSARYGPLSVYSKTKNKLFVFGGWGQASNHGIQNSYFFIILGVGRLNDFWEYDLTTDQWTWLSGSQQNNGKAQFYEKGVPHPDNTPGSRLSGCLWEDLNGNIWLFGGYGDAPNGEIGMILSDESG